MKITFLGTGTSQGIPVIGCACQVCQSPDPKDKRLRTAAMISDGETNIVIDVGPDFRQQMLANKVMDIDAVIITHEHNDHIIGLDDIRPFYFKKGDGIDYFTTQKVAEEIINRFPYVFKKKIYPGAPRIQIHKFNPGEAFTINGILVTPIEVWHGKMPVTAFRIKNILYITDASFIPENALEIMKGVDIMVINALRKEPHYSHFTLQEALEIIEIINPKKAYLTHLSHLMGKSCEIEKLLPQNVFLAYDGLKVEA